MKCPRCNGNGSVPYHIADDLFDETNCPLCGGSGEVMTEQEYIQSCNTEQLAEAITDFIKRMANAEEVELNINKVAWIRWLKQPHNS